MKNNCPTHEESLVSDRVKEEGRDVYTRGLLYSASAVESGRHLCHQNRSTCVHKVNYSTTSLPPTFSLYVPHSSSFRFADNGCSGLFR